MGFAGSTEVREYPREVPKVESQVEGSPALTMASSMQHASQEPLSLSLIAKDERARTLGLVPHACLRQLLVDPSSDKTEFELESCLLEAPPDLPEASALVEGKFSEVDKNLQGKSKVLVEYKEYGQPPKRQNMTTCANPNDETRVRQLASLLSSSGSHDLRTLPFKGYVNQENRKRHAFIFKFPENALRAEPTSLHSMIDAESLTSRLSLPSRFHVAQTVSKTIGAFHADGWVHKSVRSQSIVFFQSLELPPPLAVKSPYLVNFEYSRPETAVTLFTSYDDLERNLYCHPDRQGPPKTSFSKLHDLYALGVVLLEIGIWQTVLSIYKQYCGRMKEGVTPSPRDIQKIFIDVAKKRLSHHMGPAYVSAVLACLSGEFEDKTSRADFPMMFQSKVVDKLDMKEADR